MKRNYLLIAFLMIALGSYAQKASLHTSTGVTHYNGTGALLSAYNTATSGDTIYLSGGGFTSPATIDKGLRIYGAGHYPDSTMATAKTILNGNIALSENADRLHLEGIELNGWLHTTNNHAIDQVVIKYCRIIGDINIQGDFSNPCQNWLLINCAFSAITYFTNIYNCAVYNSILQGPIVGSGHLFENNLFLLTSSSWVVNGNNNIFRNNIFSGAQYSNVYITGYSNQIYNNIFQASPNLGTSFIATDNYFPFDRATIFNNAPNEVFNYDYDYHLQNPETYLGEDGTPVGIYGGKYPYKEGAVPSNPHIYMKNIAAQTDNQGQLQIHIGVEAQTR